MSMSKKYNTVIINIMLAVVVCLIINFSYLLAIREQDRREAETTQRLQREIENQPSITGKLYISKDGYGYIVSFPDSIHVQADSLTVAPADTLAAGPVHDSVLVSAREIGRLSIANGDTLRVLTREGWIPGANPVMSRVLDVNGEPFDHSRQFDHPSDNLGMVLQLVFYFAFTFILLTVMTAGAARNASIRFYLVRTAYCALVAVLLWFLMPTMRPGSDSEITILADIMKDRRFPFNLRSFPIDIMLMKSLFVFAFALLYGRTYQLIYQREGIMLENEQLKSENLSARYNTLVNQINPHFLFNSLNSLSALVREGKSDDAILYIDRLSDTFRYTIRNDASTTTTLGEELEFVTAYKYLLEVRYAEKLFIDIDIESEKLGWKLPTFSIQPLIENAVKHNTITRARPLHISIRTEGDRLVVSNPINPKIDPEKGTGIGLANLANRWQLLTGRGIEVKNNGKTFSVELPFIV